MEERVIQRGGGVKMKKNGDMETFLCITYTDKVSDKESFQKGWFVCSFTWPMRPKKCILSVALLFVQSFYILATFGLKMRYNKRP